MFAGTPYFYPVHRGVLPDALALFAKSGQIGGGHAKDQGDEEAAGLRQAEIFAQGEKQ